MGLAPSTLRERVEPTPKAGGTPSIVTQDAIEVALAVVRDATAGELTAEFNRGRSRQGAGPCLEHEESAASSWLRCKKKRRRPLESLRPDVVVKREAFLSKIRRVPFERLVFLDESGMNVAMSRSHAWVKRGEELVDRVPMNWGKNLTLRRSDQADGMGRSHDDVVRRRTRIASSCGSRPSCCRNSPQVTSS